MIETIKNRNRLLALPLALTLGLGLTACGGSKGGNEHKETSVTGNSAVQSGGIKSSTTFYNNGTRELKIDRLNIEEVCDGPDLVETSYYLTRFGDGGSGMSIDRSVNYPGCADGKLTPSDFKLPEPVK